MVLSGQATSVHSDKRQKPFACLAHKADYIKHRLTNKAA
jgi:hypothetical protein